MSTVELVQMVAFRPADLCRASVEACSLKTRTPINVTEWNGMALLEVKNLHVEVDGKKILNGLDLVVEKGSVHAIMGPNGSGKSTLAHVLAGKADYVVTARAGAARRRGHS